MQKCLKWRSTIHCYPTPCIQDTVGIMAAVLLASDRMGIEWCLYRWGLRKTILETRSSFLEIRLPLDRALMTRTPLRPICKTCRLQGQIRVGLRLLRTQQPEGDNP